MKNIIAVVLLISSGHTWADLVWTGPTNITQLYPHPDALQFFITTPIDLSTCGNGKRLMLDKASEEYSTYVSLLLAAYMAGKQVNFAIEDTQLPSCSPKIYKFKVYN